MDRKSKNKQILQKRKKNVWSGHWKDLKLNLHQLFRDYSVIPEVLTSIILSYCAWSEWENTVYTNWKISGAPHSICGDQKSLYVCVAHENLVLTYNLNGEILEQNTSFNSPSGIDIDSNKSLLYVADQTHITLFSLQHKTIISSWKLPVSNTWTSREIKVNENLIYLTLFGEHKIYVYSSNNGEVIHEFGTDESSSERGKFSCPYGLTVVMEYLYICDSNNHRIQLLKKDTGMFHRKWGKFGTKKGEFDYPDTIFYDILENLFFIGDSHFVQLFQNGQCLQRIGDRNVEGNIFGLCRIANRLYVCDHMNARIKIYSQME